MAAIFKAVAVDVGAASIAFQVAGTPGKVNDFLDLVRPYGIVDLVKSGRIAVQPRSRAVAAGGVNRERG